MRRRDVAAIIGVLLGIPILLAAGFAGYWSLVAVNPVEGSPELASQWVRELSGYADPQTALAANPQIIIVNYLNGDWIFGLAQDSHGLWHKGGGTSVMKDSTGAIHVYFGHVCGPSSLGIYGSQTSSLDRFYKALAEKGFTEQILAQQATAK